MRVFMTIVVFVLMNLKQFSANSMADEVIFSKVFHFETHPINGTSAMVLCSTLVLTG